MRVSDPPLILVDFGQVSRRVGRGCIGCMSNLVGGGESELRQAIGHSLRQLNNSQARHAHHQRDKVEKPASAAEDNRRLGALLELVASYDAVVEAVLLQLEHEPRVDFVEELADDVVVFFFVFVVVEDNYSALVD